MKISQSLKQTLRRLPKNNSAIFAMVLGLSVLGTLAVTTPVAAQTAAWVDARVQWASPAAGSAKSTVVGWETNDCTDAFNSNKASMPHSTETEQRNVVNASAYDSNVWLTRAGDPRDINNPAITAGTGVGMQINNILFLCSIVTMDPTGFALQTDHEVTNSNYPNDRAPVPDSGAAQYKVNQASRYESNSKIYGVAITSGPGSITNNPVNKILGYKRDNNSRYWDAAAVPFTYNTPASLAPGKYTVTIRMDYSTIQTYHAYGAAGTSRCTLTNGTGADVTYNNFSNCIHYSGYYQFTFTVKAPPVPYDLTPSVGTQIKENGTPVAGSVAQVGDTVTFTYQVSNSGDASDGTTTCNIYGNSHVGAFTIPNPVEKTSSGGYVAPSTGCPRVFQKSPPATTLTTETITIAPADINHTICRSLWINPAKLGGVAVGAEACVTVAAKPYVKVFGGDVSAGNGLATAAGTCTPGSGAVEAWNRESAGGFAGAGAQYAVMALGAIQDFASAQNVGGAAPPTGLSFANTGAGVVNTTTGLYGGSLTTVPCMTDYYAKMPTSGVTALSGAINISSLTTGAYSATGNVTISGGNVNPNNRIVLYITGNSKVFITGDIKYVGSWSVDNMPLFELIGKGSDFFIGNGVKQLDGAYIAEPNGGTGGTIDDCATGFAQLPLDGNLYNACNTKLTVNGLFSAGKVLLERMPGTVAQSNSGESSAANSAAEVFNYNPSIWIAQPPTSTVSGSSSVGSTYDAITSLPPVL